MTGRQKNLHTSIRKSMLVIGITFLLLGAGVVLAANTQPTTRTAPIARAGAWSDNFDSYDIGPLHGIGGWAGWDNNAAATGYVTDAQARSTPNSLESEWFTTVASDMVQQFTGIDTGTWVFTAWLYVPSNETGTQFFILMNTYTPGGTHNNQDWSLQLMFSAHNHFISDFNDETKNTTLLTDTWVPIQVNINFDTDVQTVLYNGVQLLQKSWKNGVQQGGAQNLACVDLFAGNSASTSVYWDDLSVTPPIPLSCDAGGPYENFPGIDIQFQGTANGGTPPYTWAWQFGDGNSANIPNPIHPYAQPGTYTATLTVTDAAQGTASDTATVTISPIPIEITKIAGGKGITVTVKNNGTINATNIHWSITLNGGLILKGKSYSSTILSLGAGKDTTVNSAVFGFGRTKISVTAGDQEKNATGFVFLMFVLGVR